MSNRRKLAAMVVGVCILAGIGVMIRERAMASESTSDLHSVSLAGWPSNQTWSWSFQLPNEMPDGEGISLRLRSKTSTLSAGENVIFESPCLPITSANADHEFGAGSLIYRRGAESSGMVTIQLLDFSAVGIASSKPGRDLRVLGNINIGGTSVDLAGGDIYLPAGHFAGHSNRSEGHWFGNELDLMTFYVQQDRTVVRYDVFVKQAAIRQTH